MRNLPCEAEWLNIPYAGTCGNRVGNIGESLGCLTDRYGRNHSVGQCIAMPRATPNRRVPEPLAPETH